MNYKYNVYALVRNPYEGDEYTLAEMYIGDFLLKAIWTIIHLRVAGYSLVTFEWRTK